MNCALIYRELSDKEILQVKELYTNGAEVRISPLQSIPNELSHIKIKTIHLEEAEKSLLAHNIKKELLNYGNTNIKGKTIKEWLAIRNTSLWYYHKHRIYIEVSNYYFTLKEINKYENRYKSTYIYSPISIDSNQLGENTTLYLSEKQPAGFNLFTLFRFCTSFCWKAIIGLSQRIKYRNAKHIIISNSNTLGRYLNLETLNEDIEDVFLGYLRQQTDNTFLHLKDLTTPKQNSKNAGRHLNPTFSYPIQFSEYVYASGLLQLKNHVYLLKKHKQFKSFYQGLNNQESFVNKLITEKLIQYHNSSIFYTYKLLAFQSYFANTETKTITAQDENATSTKIILDAAKFNNIKTIGIQHGIIGEFNMNYLFTKEDKIYHPMPDQTLVWGDYWKSILINEKNFPANAVKIVGQIRTDVIPQLKAQSNTKLYEKESIYKHIVVFASQPQPDPVLRKQAAEDVFKAVLKFDTMLLIIKMHPREMDNNYYNDIAKNLGCKNYIIEKEIDLYKVLAACDVVITCYSTVGGEAVYLGKPLVILDHLRLDYCGYYKEGVAKRATNAMELENILRDYAAGNFVPDKQHNESFIAKYAYKIDGMVSKRCLNYIMDLE